MQPCRVGWAHQNGANMKFIVPIVAAFLLLFPSFSLAETKEIITEGTYKMGDGETPTVAESRALLQANRTAVEEVLLSYNGAFPYVRGTDK